MPISGSGKKILQQVMYYKLKAVSRQRPAFVPHYGRRLDPVNAPDPGGEMNRLATLAQREPSAS